MDNDTSMNGIILVADVHVYLVPDGDDCHEGSQDYCDTAIN